jgi:hypothetical protein
MGWVEDLHGKTVGLDTAPLIFYIEDHPAYANLLDPFFRGSQGGRDTRRHVDPYAAGSSCASSQAWR